MFLRLLGSFALAWALLSAGAAHAQDAAASALSDEVVENFRRIILLHETHPGKQAHAQTTAGRYLFFQNRVLAGRLVAMLVADPLICSAALARIDATPDWRDIDRLALGGALTELTLRLPADAPCLQQAQKLRAGLGAIRARYNTEVTQALGGHPGSTGSERVAWQAYLAFLRERYAGRQAAPDLSDIAQVPLVEGAAALARQGERDEWTDGGLPARSLLLTFDDGPHALYTPRILDILAHYRIKAVFFQIGQNIGALGAAGAAGATIREPQIMERILAEGHAVANHTHTHPLLPRLDELKLTDEIDRTEALLSAATRGHAGRASLFRPPYGARNDLVLAEVTARGLRSVLWNIDSRDWADPVSHSVARRVIEESIREGRGIVLFHDIHARAAEALPTVIEELQKRGFRFARFANGKLVVDD